MHIADSESLETVLIRRIAEGDAAALGALYDKHSPPLYSVALLILDDPRVAEEVIEEVFLRIWQEAYSFDETKGTPLRWTVCITCAQTMDRLNVRRQRLGTARPSVQKWLETSETSRPARHIDHRIKSAGRPWGVYPMGGRLALPVR